MTFKVGDRVASETAVVGPERRPPATRHVGRTRVAKRVLPPAYPRSMTPLGVPEIVAAVSGAGSVLDASCGSARLTVALADAGAAEVVGIDTSRERLDRGTTRLSTHPVGPRFKLMAADFDQSLSLPGRAICRHREPARADHRQGPDRDAARAGARDGNRRTSCDRIVGASQRQPVVCAPALRRGDGSWSGPR